MSTGRLRAELQQIAEGAEWHARNYVLDYEPDQMDLELALADFMAVYCQTGSLLTADWYNSLDSDTPHYFATPEFVVPPQRAADTAAWVFKGRKSDTPSLARRVGAAAYTMVFDAARDTVAANSVREEVAFVREEEPDACDDCIGRATLTPRTRNSSTGDVTWERHQRCEFLFVPVRKDVWTPPAHASSWQERILATRLAQNANADDIAKLRAAH
ncbi:MuF-like minor capsid protein [Mycobacterium phage LittleLaf]|uniref:MuF-like minor capsid protein n=12 Tax=Marvinvirus TaxID=1982091 RepID=A0A3G8FEY7_9CAUD|nr:MuF-like minor capsid protein [Mycobacterium phage MosMoris]YP_009614153.1 hypothetical protein FDI61_gp035 [Mycobacterium phage Marvin]ANM46259.1 MuF-like minor capsid protein [Mycobacterium phage Gattaca]AVE00782.1 MuF-like minor capsid protein [Mycobacterium phage Tesla]AYB69843.1 MuF-like minor capsid protein [Mycobacterium phage LittleLaf]AZF93305.1 MuF-like minor capsid protein [Mycobacterium phage Beelzebub]QAX93088.1 MuF-like minor capsid protein [Mycobacterium phage RedRaider77]Q